MYREGLEGSWGGSVSDTCLKQMEIGFFPLPVKELEFKAAGHRGRNYNQPFYLLDRNQQILHYVGNPCSRVEFLSVLTNPDGVKTKSPLERV